MAITRITVQITGVVSGYSAREVNWRMSAGAMAEAGGFAFSLAYSLSPTCQLSPGYSHFPGLSSIARGILPGTVSLTDAEDIRREENILALTLRRQHHAQVRWAVRPRLCQTNFPWLCSSLMWPPGGSVRLRHSPARVLGRWASPGRTNT